MVRSVTYDSEPWNDRDVAAHLDGIAFIGGVSPPASAMKKYEEEFRAEARRWFISPDALVFDARDRLWYATTRDRDDFSYLDVWVGSEYAGTVRIRDRLMGYDVLGSTLVALVERKPGRDGIAAQALDWYDIGDLEFGQREHPGRPADRP